MMKRKKLRELLLELNNYVFEHPYYDRTDLILKRVFKRIYTCLSPSEKREDLGQSLRTMIEEMRMVQKKRIERQKQERDRMEQLRERLERYEEPDQSVQELERELEILKSDDERDSDTHPLREIFLLKNLTDETLSQLISLASFLDRHKIFLEILNIQDISWVIKTFYRKRRFNLTKRQEEKFKEIARRCNYLEELKEVKED